MCQSCTGVKIWHRYRHDINATPYRILPFIANLYRLYNLYKYHNYHIYYEIQSENTSAISHTFSSFHLSASAKSSSLSRCPETRTSLFAHILAPAQNLLLFLLDCCLKWRYTVLAEKVFLLTTFHSSLAPSPAARVLLRGFESWVQAASTQSRRSLVHFASTRRGSSRVRSEPG